MELSNIEKQIEKDYLGFSGTIVSALRYCLGRRTYMPSLVTGFVSTIIPDLQTKDLSIIRRDILEQGEHSWVTSGDTETVDERGLYKSAYGDDCDYIVWMQFLKKIETELDKREVAYEH